MKHPPETDCRGLNRRYLKAKASEHMVCGAGLLLLAPLLMGLAWFNAPSPWDVMLSALAAVGLVKGVGAMRRAMFLFDRAETEGRDG